MGGSAISDRSRSRVRLHSPVRWRLRLLLLVLLVPGLTILQVLVLRWLDPPTSMVMLAQRFESRDVAGFELDYRWRDWQSLSPQVPIALRSEERRVGKACGRTCGFRWSPDT